MSAAAIPRTTKPGRTAAPARRPATRPCLRAAVTPRRWMPENGPHAQEGLKRLGPEGCFRASRRAGPSGRDRRGEEKGGALRDHGKSCFPGAGDFPGPLIVDGGIVDGLEKKGVVAPAPEMTDQPQDGTARARKPGRRTGQREKLGWMPVPRGYGASCHRLSRDRSGSGRPGASRDILQTSPFGKTQKGIRDTYPGAVHANAQEPR